MENSINFYQVVPDSQSYDKLEQIYQAIWMLRHSQSECGQLTKCIENELGYILTGIDNTINNGYQIQKREENGK